MWNRGGSLWRATHKRPRPLSHLRCQLSQRESLWRNRRLCNLPDNFPAMPRAPSQRGLSAQQTGGVSADTPSVTAYAVPAPPRGRLCAMPETLCHRQKPSPWTDSPRPGRDVALATEWGAGGIAAGDDGRGDLRSGALCTSARNFPAMPRALPLGELARSA